MKSQDNNGCFSSFKRRSAIQCPVRRVLLCLFFLVSCIVHRAFGSEPPEQIPLTYQSILVGVGQSNIYDTYLSPLKYRGVNLNIMSEQMKMTGLGNGNLSVQHLFNIGLADTKNPTETATNYLGILEYSYGMHYHFKQVQRIRFMAGMQLDGLIGGIYNTRNGNNPATAKAHINLNLSGMATYRIQIKKQPIRLRYQLNFSVLGLQFSPEYGQSYYEIELGTKSKLIHRASFHNQLAMRNIFSVELPFNFCTFRLSYMNWIYETRISGLNTQILSGSFYLGFSRNFFSVRGRKAQSHFQTVFD
jgi:hypothetical protein